MAQLSAPTIGEPLYECAAKVIVSGYVPGATVNIYARPPGSGPTVQVGGGPSLSPGGQVFGVDATSMVAGARLTATQTFAGVTSPLSADVILQKPLSVDAPVLHAPLFACAHCIRVEGLLPGVSVQVNDAEIVLGQTSTASEAARVSMNPALVAGHIITARQVHCGSAGVESPGLRVTDMDEGLLQLRLTAPEVAGPLFACQPSCRVEGCMPGSEVELFINAVPTSAVCSSGTAVNLAVSGGLVAGASITARQSLCGAPTALSSPVVVQPAQNIPRPAIWRPLYEGDTSVLVGMTIVGELVTITADSVQVGMGGTAGGDVLLNVDPPLRSGQKIVATMELCSVTKSSLSVPVLPAPKTVPPPTVVTTLLACSPMVSVKDCIPGAEIRIFASAGVETVLLGSKKVLGISTTVPVTPPLKAGWSIHATQKVGGITSSASAAVTVTAPPAVIPAPNLVMPILACSRCVRVEQVFLGARIDVYQDDVWVGATNTSSSVADVEVYPELTAGAFITATQTVCGRVSDAGRAVVAPQVDTVPAPHLFSAFQNGFHVAADNLLPGAIVEVEEVSTYKQVIGKTCATATVQSIGLNLPLFYGALLRARQKLCITGPFSQPIGLSTPKEWPLGPGPFKAGFRLVDNIPVSKDITFIGINLEQCYVVPPRNMNKAIIFYPATVDGEDPPFAAGGPFPVIVFGHARRLPSLSCIPGPPACPGAPIENTDDYRQLSGILSHLARWGFVSIAPDLSWLAYPIVPLSDWILSLSDAASYITAENTRPGSLFEGKLNTATIGLMGHSTGGHAAIELATNGPFSVDALGLIAPAAFSGTDFDVISNFSPRPIIVLRGNLDTGVNGDHGASLNWYSGAAPKKHLVRIEGANHFGFTDALCLETDPTAAISQPDQSRIARAYLTAFFRRYLSGVLELEDYLTGAAQVEELDGFSITIDAQT